MTNEKIPGVDLPGWLRYGLGNDGKMPSNQSNKLKPITPMNEETKRLAQSISDEIWRQRMTAIDNNEDVSITLRGESLEGLEQLLWALAEEDYTYANVRVEQLLRGLMKDAPQWRDDFEEES